MNVNNGNLHGRRPLLEDSSDDESTEQPRNPPLLRGRQDAIIK